MVNMKLSDLHLWNHWDSSSATTISDLGNDGSLAIMIGDFASQSLSG